MAKFKYNVKNAKGENFTDSKEAVDKESLVAELQKQGFFIISIEEDKGKSSLDLAAKLASPKKFAHREIKMEDLLSFARQLATMLEAGVNLHRSLGVITEQVESEKLFKLLSQITSDVESGKSLSEAFAAHPKVFNQFWVSLVEVGEASGTMPIVLDKLAFYLEQQAAFRSTVTSAVMYPLVLFCVCIFAVAFFALFVGPRFEKVFQSMDVELPFLTRFLLGFFHFVQANFFLLGLAIFGGVFMLKKYVATPIGRQHFELFLFSLPVFGKIYRLIIVERFASQMSILVETGVPILYALEVTQRFVNSSICSKVVNDIKESVRQGELLAAPMERSKFFPSMAIQMITVGEETGELDKMLKHVAGFYQSNVETFMKRFGTLIEPIMLVVMGVVIGIIVIAMFLPMFNIAQLGGASG